jgi:membrane protein DedA with SNARE-associated domain
MFFQLEQVLNYLSTHMPLFVFTPLASLVEEAIPPIPSPSIMMISGFLASVQDYSLILIIGLCVFGSVGKTFGAWFVYFVSDKVEDVLTGRFGRFIGVSHEEIEAFGQRLGRGWRDYFILTFLRALPIVPSTILSVGGGLLKIPLRLYLISTLAGSLIRNALYIYLGYMGSALALSLVKKTTSTESFLQIAVVIIILIVLAYLYYRRRKML